jgi:hypothetical protein
MTSSHTALALLFAPALALAAPAHAERVVIEARTATPLDPACSSGLMEPLGFGWVSTAKDEATGQPRQGEAFYVRTGFLLRGEVCGSAALIRPELKLPEGVALAVRPNAPVLCEVRTLATDQVETFSCDDVAFSAGPHGGLLIENRGASNRSWRVARGTSLELSVPVVSTQRSGAGDPGAAPLPLQTFIAYQANLSGLLQATVPLTVFANPPSLAPLAALGITHEGALLSAVVGNHHVAGEAFIDVGTTGFSYDVRHGPFRVEAEDFERTIGVTVTGLPADTLVHWRVRFVTDEDAVFAGADQTFRTLAEPRYRVVTTATSGGRVLRSDNADAYLAGTTVTFAAMPDAGCRFERLIVDGREVEGSSVTLVIERAHSVHAVFSVPPAPATGPAPAPQPDDEPVPFNSEPSGTATARELQDEAAGCSSARGAGATPVIGLALPFLLVAGRPRRRA